VQRFAVLTLLAVAACNSGSATQPPQARPTPRPPTPRPAPSPAPKPDAGVDVSGLGPQETYVALCAPCHAKDAKGGAADHAPSLVNPTFLESASDDYLRKSIALGRPGTSMAAYGKAMGGPLDDARVDGIVRWLREVGATPATKKLEQVAKGDALGGEKLYTEYCRTCHGDAKTRGEAVHLANVQFLQLATDAFIRHAISVGRPGTKMPGFGAVMTPQQMNDLVAYIRTLGGGAAAVTLLPAPTGKEPLVLNPSGKDPQWKSLRAENGVGRYVSVDEVKKALDDKRKLVIIDARPPSEWMRAHITGAVSIPYHDMKRLDEVPRDGTWVIAYCGCPHHLSGIVVDELRRRGYTNAAVLDEGINEWHRRGLPVVAAEGVASPLPEPVPHRHR